MRGEGQLQDAGTVLDGLLRRLGGTEQQGRLVRLWQNWSMVMGPDIAALAWPLGHRNGTLLVGGEDAMVMQELHMASGEILERANAFMDAPFFSEVRVSLALGRNPLDAVMLPEARRPQPVVPPPRPTGAYLSGMDPESPVARCYARFAGKTPRDAARTHVAPEDGLPG